MVAPEDSFLAPIQDNSADNKTYKMNGNDDDSNDDNEDAPLSLPLNISKSQFQRCNCRTGIDPNSLRFLPIGNNEFIGTSVLVRKLHHDLLLQIRNTFAASSSSSSSSSSSFSPILPFLPEIVSYLPIQVYAHPIAVSHDWYHAISSTCLHYIHLRNLVPIHVIKSDIMISFCLFKARLLFYLS